MLWIFIKLVKSGDAWLGRGVSFIHCRGPSEKARELYLESIFDNNP